ncbi:unnamed protein product [Microthlaspi erraticum]|uniref:HSF-type DNA-binding domain-containing protein n=1 Tax=Microthlaspi erraticum TaxID=1685480 RepID=A0A6D2L1K5_9BRAS|nr:unnamed protein product [Microthlaspi erraticum]
MIQKLPKDLSSFYIQLYQIVDDSSTDPIISWSKSSNDNSFVVWDLKKLQRDILTKSSGLGRSLKEFLAELRNHGFKAVVKGPGELEFVHEDFARGLMTKKMMAKALSERIERVDAQIKAMKCRVKSRKANLRVENLFQKLRI